MREEKGDRHLEQRVVVAVEAGKGCSEGSKGMHPSEGGDGKGGRDTQRDEAGREDAPSRPRGIGSSGGNKHQHGEEEQGSRGLDGDGRAS